MKANMEKLLLDYYATIKCK